MRAQNSIRERTIDRRQAIVDQLMDVLEPLGLIVRGGFRPRPGDQAPDGTGAIVLIGNAGRDLFRVFQPPLDGAPHPLDRWTRETIDPLADRFGARALYPFEGPPHWPFQRWAKASEPVHSSPLGLLIHPEYGLWHAYRAALAFDGAIDLPERPDLPSPCATCADKPCLSGCPVGAFSGDGYDVPACTGHLETADGSQCLEAACLARRACPVGEPYRYSVPQAIFHTSAFLDRHSPPRRGDA